MKKTLASLLVLSTVSAFASAPDGFRLSSAQDPLDIDKIEDSDSYIVDAGEYINIARSYTFRYELDGEKESVAFFQNGELTRNVNPKEKYCLLSSVTSTSTYSGWSGRGQTHTSTTNESRNGGILIEAYNDGVELKDVELYDIYPSNGVIREGSREKDVLVVADSDGQYGLLCYNGIETVGDLVATIGDGVFKIYRSEDLDYDLLADQTVEFVDSLNPLTEFTGTYKASLVGLDETDSDVMIHMNAIDLSTKMAAQDGDEYVVFFQRQGQLRPDLIDSTKTFCMAYIYADDENLVKDLAKNNLLALPKMEIESASHGNTNAPIMGRDEDGVFDAIGETEERYSYLSADFSKEIGERGKVEVEFMCFNAKTLSDVKQAAGLHFRFMTAK